MPPSPIQTGNLFLKLPGIKGDSKHPTYKDDISVRAWSWGMTLNANASRGSGPRMRSAPEFRQLTVHKVLDRSSPALMSALTRATNFDDAKLISCTMINGTAHPLLTITMHDVLIAAITSLGQGEGDYPEDVMFDFSKVNVSYNRIDKDGVAQGAVEFNHDLKINK